MLNGHHYSPPEPRSSSLPLYRGEPQKNRTLQTFLALSASFLPRNLRRRIHTTWLNLKTRLRRDETLIPTIILLIVLILCISALWYTVKWIFKPRKQWQSVDWNEMTYTGDTMGDFDDWSRPATSSHASTPSSSRLPQGISPTDLSLSEDDWFQVSKEWDHKNFTDLGIRLRLFLPRFDIMEKLIDHSSSPDFNGWGNLYLKVDEFRNWVSLMESRMFPWTKPYYGSLIEMKREWKQGRRGIVMTAGSGHERQVTFLIKSVRFHGCKLPIEIWFIGEKDLNLEAQKRLKTLDDSDKGAGGVQLRDITRIFNQSDIVLEGWDVKPFSILASSFRECLFMDADVVWLENPENVFNDAVYRSTRTLFYYDRRTLFGGDDEHADFVKTFIPDPPSKSIKKNGIYNKITLHEQESGVVVVDKIYHFHGLLGTCKMNEKLARDDVTYKIFHGDKETFWAGFEMANDTRYGFSPHFAGTLGKLLPGHIDPLIALRNGSMIPKDDVPLAKQKWLESNVRRVCALQLAHPNSKGNKISWFNGGILRNKFAEGEWGKADQGPLIDAEMWLTEPARWELFEDNVVCIYLEDKGQELNPFGKEEKKLLLELGELWKQSAPEVISAQAKVAEIKAAAKKSAEEEEIEKGDDVEKRQADEKRESTEEDPFTDTPDTEDVKKQREENSKWITKVRNKAKNQ